MLNSSDKSMFFSGYTELGTFGLHVIGHEVADTLSGSFETPGSFVALLLALIVLKTLHFGRKDSHRGCLVFLLESLF